MAIARDEAILGGEPRIEGTRIGVRHVAARVIDAGKPPAYVADQLDLSLAEVYEALSYYDEHDEEFRAIESENEEAMARLRAVALHPKDPAE